MGQNLSGFRLGRCWGSVLGLWLDVGLFFGGRETGKRRGVAHTGAQSAHGAHAQQRLKL